MGQNNAILLREQLYAGQRENFWSFVQMAFKELRGNIPLHKAPYLEYMCAELERCVMHQPQRMLFALPPRHLKSFVLSICLPAWLLGHHPDWKIILCSYAQDVAEDKGLECLNLIRSQAYRNVFPHVQVRDSKAAKGDFEITAGGGMYCTSITGSITGKGADVLLIDDPVKAIDAHSSHIMAKVERFFRESAITRLNQPEGGIVIVNMQRLATNDLIGVLKELKGYRLYSFPLVAEQDEVYRLKNGREVIRKVGELLSPEHFTQKAMEDRKLELGERAFSAQYQQRPLMAATQLLRPESFKTYSVLPPAFQKYINTVPFRTIVISIDAALKAGPTSDFTGISVGVVEGYNRQSNFYILEIARRRYEFTELYSFIKGLAQQYKHLGNIQFWIEATASGVGIAKMLERDGFHVVTINVTSSKEGRMREVMDVFESGQVYLPEHAAWKKDFLDEAYSFPTGEYDDQVDALIQMVLYQVTRVQPRIRQL